MAVQCKIDIPAVQGLNDNELTVGREFILVCDGDFPTGLQVENLNFILAPETKYVIHLRGFEFRSPTQADIKVTAYRAGQFQFPDLQLTDGTQTLSLGKIEYQVASVIEKDDKEQQPGQQAQQEPFGPFGPAPLPIPMEYWAGLAAFLGVILLLVLTKIFRVVQRRRMLEGLKEHDAALAPLPQFHQNLRRLQRQNPVFAGVPASRADLKTGIEDLNQMFRLFVLRRFRVPTFAWSDRLILAEIKKYHPKVYAEYGVELKRVLKELARALEDQEKLEGTDVLNIATRVRILAEGMERVA